MINNKTKVRFLGEMQQAERFVLFACVYCLLNSCVSDRVRFAMWCGNDYLPAFQGVGWIKVKALHTEFEGLDEEHKVALLPERPHPHHDWP